MIYNILWIILIVGVVCWITKDDEREEDEHNTK